MGEPPPAAAPRYGALWARAVLRPFSVQVLAALTAAPGDLVVDLSDDDGTTTGLLRGRGLCVVPAETARGDREVPGNRRTPIAAVVAVHGGMGPPRRSEFSLGSEGIPRQTLLCSWLAAPHEDAVRRAFGLRRLAAPGAAEAAARRWPDVVRFDSIDQLWAAALVRADVSRRAAAMTPTALSQAREVLHDLLAVHLTADAALRIPVAMAVRDGPA